MIFQENCLKIRWDQSYCKDLLFCSCGNHDSNDMDNWSRAWIWTLVFLITKSISLTHFRFSISPQRPKVLIMKIIIFTDFLGGPGVAAAAKSLQSCPILCDPIDSSPPGSPFPGILQARTLEWVAISFSNAWKWKWKWSHSVVSDSSRPHGLQPTRLLRPWDFPGKSTGVGCHCLLRCLD